MKNLFNTVFETSLRIIILLNNLTNSISIDKITSLDLIATYGKDFGFSEYNLHGNNRYNFGEFASKRDLVSLAIKDLVLKGYVNVTCNKLGINYSITVKGKQYCNKLSDDYCEEYTSIIKKINSIFIDYSDRNILMYINNKAKNKTGGME